MKKITNCFLIISIMMSSFLFINNVSAVTYTATVTDKDGINVRSGAGTDYSIEGSLNYNAKITLVSNAKKSGNGCSGGWYQVNYGGSKSRYICSEFVKVTSSGESATITKEEYYTIKNWVSRINENFTNIRTGAGTSYKVQDTVYLGTEVEVIDTLKDWYKVKYYNNKTGYVYKPLVSFYDEIVAKDTAYEKTLKKAGFPESYYPYLTYLHKKHPNWKFTAVNTNKYFDTAVDKEVGKNYTQSTIATYRQSNTLREKPNWYTASKGVVAFYLDPRNYLNEKNIYVFENLSYDEVNHTKDILSQIFKGSYLNTDTYINYYLSAGKTYNISPVHLAARTKQEGGTNSSYDGVSGKVSTTWDRYTGYVCSSNVKLNSNNKTGYISGRSGVNLRKSNTTSSDILVFLRKNQAFTLSHTTKYTGKGCPAGWYKISVKRTLTGYYNYYNIGAYGSNPVIRGLAVAAGYIGELDGTPWNTREKAIKYGAKFIAENYTDAGQDTLYFQKFNTGPSGNYNNQFMTNVTAPASEAISTYDSYNEIGITSKGLSFKIPVYKNMPSNATTLPPLGNTNNSLSTITIDGTKLSGFDSDVLTYVKYISDKTTKVEVKATPSASTSKVKGVGTINTPNNETTVSIKVTSEVGTSKTYKITLVKVKSADDGKILSPDEIINKIDVKYSNTYLSGIRNKTSAATLTNMIQNKEPSAKVEITTKNGVKKTGNLVTGDILTIISNNTTKKITISIKGDANGDGKVSAIDLFQIQKHILKKTTLKNEYLEAADANYNGKVTSIDLFQIQKEILGKTILK